MEGLEGEGITIVPCVIGGYSCSYAENVTLSWNNDVFRKDEECIVHWWSARDLISITAFILLAILLVIFNILVIGGNLLVIISVFTCRKLRTVTNTYIVSLAFADLLLGVFVLPFSGTKEVLRFWPFGTIWCGIWLAVDVWLCTASILNLCVISFDRYLAISRPFRYQTIMCHWKAKALVGTVWVVAFIVCAPPLIDWNESDESGDGNIRQLPTTETMPSLILLQEKTTSMTSQQMGYRSTGYRLTGEQGEPDTTKEPITTENCEDSCTLNSKRGYVIYSALGSFWIPVWIMAFFYWRIYSIAARTTRGVRRGVLRTRSGGSSTTPENTVTLRIHRGGSCQRHASLRSTYSSRSESQSESLIQNSPSMGFRKGSAASMRSLKRENSMRNDSLYKQIRSNSTADCGTASSSNGSRASIKVPRVKVTFSNTDNNNGSSKMQSKPNPNQTASSPNGLLAHSIIEEEETSFTDINQSSNGIRQHNGSTNSRSSHRFNIVNRLKTYNREKKAAKTVGIIVGCFVFCWAPFFTVYLLLAFCEQCTPDVVFTVFFWLGYCNSAINPCVYALFSKDFRFAFKKLLCCRCERKRPTLRESRQSRFRSFINSFKIQISSRSSDDTPMECVSA